MAIMELSQTQMIVIAVLLFVLSISFSAYSWSRINLLYLPLPVSLAAVGTLLPIITTIVVPGTVILQRRIRAQVPRISSITTYFASLSGVIMLTIALTYANSSSAQTCQLQANWQQLFHTKNANAIQTIQSTLRCCGFNNMHDRAFPFPSRDIDSRNCERTSGYNRRCLDPWRSEENRAASMVALGSLVAWALAFALHHIIYRQPSSFYGRLTSDRRPLLEDGTNGHIEEDSQRQIKDRTAAPFHDDAELDAEASGTGNRDTSGD